MKSKEQLQQELDKYKLVGEGNVIKYGKSLIEFDKKFYDTEMYDLIFNMLEPYKGKQIEFYIKEIGKE